MEGRKELKEYLEGMEQTLLCLFQSGFESVHDTTLKEMDTYAKEAKQYGFSFASKEFGELFTELSMARHQFGVNYGKSADSISRMIRYVNLCKGRLEFIQMREDMLDENSKDK